jgi:hypothetical protein
MATLTHISEITTLTHLSEITTLNHQSEILICMYIRHAVGTFKTSQQAGLAGIYFSEKLTRKLGTR